MAADEGQFARTRIRLVRDRNDASMIIRELRPVASAKMSLAGEALDVLGNISMEDKLGKAGADCKVLRPPAVLGNGKRTCVYMYSENSLLRRVVVFRKRSVIYEVELRQEADSLSFATVVDAQSEVVRGLMEGD